ncbi:hypothetical protein [Rhodopila sp.]|uniref:hypothetical protein n=1 Tax=Rhodopila sp. TaxID=2480087 RepID=UPI003D12BCF1
MINRLRRANTEQRKLLFSLGTNFATRIPGSIGVLFFLPLIRSGLGTEDYARLLAASALGIAATFLSGGFNVVGRRLVGEAYAAGDRRGEAAAFASLSVANGASVLFAFAVIIIYCLAVGAGVAYLLAAALPVVAAFFNTFDNVRSAYNEHYVTATLLILLQVIAYTIGFLVPFTRQNLVVSGFVLTSPYLFASLFSVVLLLRKRSYLTGGSWDYTWRIIREGTVYALADGLLTTTLSLAVVWLETVASAQTSAWFATLVRLFQIFLVPVILLLIPLSSYIRVVWNTSGPAKQQAFASITLLMGLGYGALVGVALLFVSRLYIGGVLHLPAPDNLLHVLPCFVLFAAIVAYRTYSSIAYLVLDDSSHLSWWTTFAVITAVIVAAASSLEIDALGAINIYAFLAGLLMIGVLFWNMTRFIRSSRSRASSGSGILAKP